MVEARNPAAPLCFDSETTWLAGNFFAAGVTGTSSEDGSSSEIGRAEFRMTLRMTLGASPNLLHMS